MLQRKYVFLLVVILPFVLGWYIIGAGHLDLSIPMVYGMHDDVWQLVLTKALIDNGWVLQNIYLGAPDIANWHYHSAAQTSAIHSVLMKVMSYFIDDAIKVQQYYYLLNFSLISFCSYLACRLLNISTLFSIASAFIFSFIAFRYNAIFFSFLANYFMVPLAIVVVIWSSLGKFTNLTSNCEQANALIFIKKVSKSTCFLLSVAIIFLISVSDGYYSFFTLLLLGFSSILVVFIKQNYRLYDSVIPLFFAMLIIVVNIIVMSPINNYKEANYDEFNPNGKPDYSLEKRPMEAEVYSSSLKLMVAPIIDHRSTTLAEIGKKIVATNDESRKYPVIKPMISLGSIPSILLVFTLMFLAVMRVSVAKDSSFTNEEALKHLKVMSILSLFVLLSSISGGIGTLVALVFPTIRAYERFPLFLIFFVLVTFSFWLTVKLPEVKKNSLMIIILTILVTAFALWDQSPITSNHSAGGPHAKRFVEEKAFIEKVELKLPPGSMIYQYPYSQYLTDNKYYGWGAFSHMRAYLHSKSLRWSNGASKNSKVDVWHGRLAKLSFEEIIREATLYGFKGVLIDRFVIEDDEFNEIKQIVKREYGINVETDEKASLAFFKLPNIGFKLINDADFTRPTAIEVSELGKLSFKQLPNFLNSSVLQQLLTNKQGQQKFKFSFDEYPELFNFQKFKLESKGINENIEKRLLLGGLRCSPNELGLTSLGKRSIRLRVHNNSELSWKLNVGDKPITIGYHLYDSKNQLIEWDNGYRVKNSVSVKPFSTSGEIQINLRDLKLEEQAKKNYLLVMELLQEGNAWFSVNSENEVCKVRIRAK